VSYHCSVEKEALTEEHELIKGCLRGKEQHRLELYRRYAGKMFPVCKRYAGNVQDAEDFLQESFIRVFDKLGHFGFQGSLEGWIRRIVVTTCINQLRTRKLTMDVDDHPGVEDNNVPDGMSQLSMNELMALIQSLPDGYRAVFNLYAIEGYDHNEIAGMLGITDSTSRSQLAKARKWLKEAYERSNTISAYAKHGS
jgi:RNA polymerase sigma-70 factor (ECF subfamily)